MVYPQGRGVVLKNRIVLYILIWAFSKIGYWVGETPFRRVDIVHAIWIIKQNKNKSEFIGVFVSL